MMPRFGDCSEYSKLEIGDIDNRSDRRAGTLPMVLIILASFQVQNDDLDDADRTAWYVILLAGTT